MLPIHQFGVGLKIGITIWVQVGQCELILRLTTKAWIAGTDAEVSKQTQN